MKFISQATIAMTAMAVITTPSSVSGHLRAKKPKKVRFKAGAPIPLALPEKLTKKKTQNKNAKGPEYGARIVGGNEVAGPGLFDFFVNWDGMCGGSLVHEDVVITAAHCYPIFSDKVTVNAYELLNQDTPGAETRTIEERLIHPNFNQMSTKNDAMLLKLDSPVLSVEPIRINTDPSKPSEDETLKVVGLGATYDYGCAVDRLREVTVEVIPDQECNDNYAEEFGEDLVVEDVMLCAGVEDGGKDSCYGDSGGPLFTLNDSGEPETQVGIVSFGLGCGQPDLPGVYTEVSAISDWILRGICALAANPPENCPDPTPMPTPPTPGPGELTITITVTTDSYPFETLWELLDDKLEVVESSSYFQPNQSFDTFVNLPKGKTFFFDMHDYNCDGGPTYKVLAGDDEVASSSGDFECIDSTMFMVPGGDISTTPDNATTPVNVNILTDSWPFETAWTMKDDEGRVVGRAPAGSFDSSETLYKSTLNLEQGKEYLFNITDWGYDGICCEYSEGYYRIETTDDLVNGTVLLASGGDFGEFETATFVVPSLEDPAATKNESELPVDDSPQSSAASSVISLMERILTLFLCMIGVLV